MSDTPANKPTQRSWKSIGLEILAWIAVSIVTAVVLIMLSDKLLPANF
jgi:hypothetical protein